MAFQPIGLGQVPSEDDDDPFNDVPQSFPTASVSPWAITPAAPPPVESTTSTSTTSATPSDLRSLHITNRPEPLFSQSQAMPSLPTLAGTYDATANTQKKMESPVPLSDATFPGPIGEVRTLGSKDPIAQRDGDGYDPKSDQDFYRGAWLSLLKLLDLPPFSDAMRLSYPIWRLFSNPALLRVTTMAVVIQAISSEGDACILVNDPTGMIGCVVEAAIMVEFELAVHSVLLLRDVPVLRPGPDTALLGITTRNISQVLPANTPRPSGLPTDWKTYDPLAIYTPISQMG